MPRPALPLFRPVFPRLVAWVGAQAGFATVLAAWVSAQAGFATVLAAWVGAQAGFATVLAAWVGAQAGFATVSGLGRWLGLVLVLAVAVGRKKAQFHTVE